MPKLGDKCFSVSWVPADKVIIEDGDHDLDQAESVRVCKRFTSEAVAITFARTVNDFYGCPTCDEVEWNYHDEYAAECGERPRWNPIREIEVANA